MSAEILKACKELQMSPAQKGVLMCIAWYATDAGEFWYSVATICEFTCLSERTVRQALHDLADKKILSAEYRTGASTKYTVTPAAFAPPQPPTPPTKEQCAAPAQDAEPPAIAAPLQEPHPATDAGEGCESCTTPPATDAAPPAAAAPDKQIQLLTTNTTKKPRAKREGQEGDISLADLIAHGVERQYAEDFMRSRRTKGSGALTKSAFERIKAEAAEAGLTLPQAIQEAAESGWTSFRAKWMQPKGPVRPSRHTGFADINYNEGLKPDGRI